MTKRWARGALAAVTLATAMVLAACGSPKSEATSGPGVTGAVTVFAASSLTETFTQIGKDFEAVNPGVKVTFNFAGSSAFSG